MEKADKSYFSRKGMEMSGEGPSRFDVGPSTATARTDDRQTTMTAGGGGRSVLLTQSSEALDDGDGLSSRRVIRLNGAQAAKFVSNEISTAKYNLLTFLPRFLLEQFRRYANIFFLVIAVLQQIPDVSPTGRYTTAVPLVFILCLSAMKEIFEDLKRHKADYKVNIFPILLWRNGAWIIEKWRNIRVGDFVKVTNKERFPADLLLLQSSEPQAMAYVETSNLDGETNLKIRQGRPETAAALRSAGDLSQLSGSVHCDLPNRHLYEFNGNLCLTEGGERFPLGPQNLLLRGAKLENTGWVICLVVYTGHESKLLMNSKKAPLKRSNVDVVTNRQIVLLFIALMLMALISAFGAQFWDTRNLKAAWYIGSWKVDKTNLAYNILTFAILYNNLIPISLQVTLEFVRFFQADFINNDVDMYHEASGTPAVARTSNLNEELGQVEYVFSDKTGTLTENIMHFKRCSVAQYKIAVFSAAGIAYGVNDQTDHFSDALLLANLDNRENPSSTVIRRFLTGLAVCHTVVPETTDTGSIKYLASSPDEGALVRAAARLGFVFHTRTPESLRLNLQGVEATYRLLHVLEFTSLRKRMGVLVRDKQNRILLFVKGADSEIFKRLRDGAPYVDETTHHLEQFATAGYRTLCVAYAEIDEAEYEIWRKRFYKASIALTDREMKLEAVAELIETNLTLLGATAIEDKLQELVPETISALMKAGVKIWLLTGDKLETAVNIGHSCSLILANMPVLMIDKRTHEDTRESIRQYMDRLGVDLLGRPNELALVIDGTSLRYALIGELRQDFLTLATSCRTVICCRASPIQKAEVVDLVRSRVGAITLAIGDGANDVAMIQAAHVGIGITGQEGLQAAAAADYAIGQFCFLAKLMFVHGAWNFHRTVKVIMYSFYKNICLYIIELWFAMYSGWSGQAMFERWCIALFNVFFTSLPPIALGLFDRTASAATMLKYPTLYRLSQDRDAFSIKIFWLWILQAMGHSILLFFVSYGIFRTDEVWQAGRGGGFLMLGNCVYTYVVVTVCLKAALETDTWTLFTHLAIWGSIVGWFVFLVLYSMVWPYLRLAPDMAGMAYIMMSSYVFWFGLLFVPSMTLLADFAYKVVRRSVFKTVADDIRELEVKENGEGDPLNLVPSLLLHRSKLADEHCRQFWSALRRGFSSFTLDVVNRAVSSDYGTMSSSAGERLLSQDDAEPTAERRLSEATRLLRNALGRTGSQSPLEQDAQHGYAFSQEERGAVSQSELVRQYDSPHRIPRNGAA